MTEIIAQLVALPAPLVWLVLLISAGIEYIVPPFPGDVIVLGGGILTGSRGLNALPVFFAVTLGSVLGAALDYQLGRWLARPGTSWLHRWAARPRVRRGIDRVCQGFAKHGDLYLLINRFFPGIRAFFFIAAGLTGKNRTRTLTLATGAALLWNGLILVVGLMIGANLQALLDFARAYSQVVWLVIILAAGFFCLRLALQAWQRKG